MSHEIIEGQLIEPTTSLSSAHAFTPTLPQAPVTVRVATMADLPAIDALQKKHSRALGFFPRQQMEGYIKGGWVLVAEGTVASGQWSVAREDERVASGQWAVAREEQRAGITSHSPLATSHSSGHSILGYVASRDRYQKRDEVGVIYQMCVAPEARRMQIAATLMREVFARAAYGCRLFCCWCAQDLKEANAFWASLGFVPLAFRAGSRSKDRVHIFWQKRVREDDASTPWWFPASTGGGAIREDRIVLPIPPGVKWDDAMPRLLPERPKALPTTDRRSPNDEKPKPKREPVHSNRQSASEDRHSLGGLSFGAPVESAEDRRARRKARLLEKLKLDPQQAATARELRDRFLEQALEGRLVLPEPQAKYTITRTLPHRVDNAPALPTTEPMKMLAA